MWELKTVVGLQLSIQVFNTQSKSKRYRSSNEPMTPSHVIRDLDSSHLKLFLSPCDK